MVAWTSGCLAPRFNAAAAWARPLAVELLTTASPQPRSRPARSLEEAEPAAADADGARHPTRAPAAADGMRPAPAPRPGVAKDGWHYGLIGIRRQPHGGPVCRPVLLIALRRRGHGVGSRRSVPGFRGTRRWRFARTLLGHGGNAAAADSGGAGRVKGRCSDGSGGPSPHATSPGGPRRRRACWCSTAEGVVPLAAMTTECSATLAPVGSIRSWQSAVRLFLAGGSGRRSRARRAGPVNGTLDLPRVRTPGAAVPAIPADRLRHGRPPTDELLSAKASLLAFTPRLNEWQG